MVSIAEIVESKEYKIIHKFFMHLGFALIIIGIFSYLNTWDYWNIIISIGGLVISLLYFLQAFEPLHEVLDWTLVYPELAGLTDDDDVKIQSDQLVKSIQDVKKSNFITEFTKTSRHCRIVEYLWYWGIMLVLLGLILLFNTIVTSVLIKTVGRVILSTGGFMLIVIYVFNTFKPLHEEYDWPLVYPELAGLTDDVADTKPETSVLSIEKTDVKNLLQQVEELVDEVKILKNR